MFELVAFSYCWINAITCFRKIQDKEFKFDRYIWLPLENAFEVSCYGHISAFTFEEAILYY